MPKQPRSKEKERVEKLEQCLRACLPLIEMCAEPCPGYGFFCGGDPRDFSPDPESSTEKEREAHKAACAAWEAQEAAQQVPQPLEGSCSLESVPGSGDAIALVTRSNFGLGVYTLRNRDAEAVLRNVRECLGEGK